MQIQKFILLFAIALFTISCEEGNIDLDNGGEEELYVQIDEIKYHMPAGSYKNITLEKGLHSISIEDASGKVLDASRFDVEKGGLLNLGKTNYIVWTELYGSSQFRKDKLKLAYFEVETIDGPQKIWGEFERLDAEKLYMETRWDHGLNEDFKEQLWRLDLIQDKYVIVRKVFREAQLFEEYKQLQNKQ
ncbi:MAG: hypothetical protein MRZ79_25550 [Bacteroidia bacterium]|nr:hypothetical protein [Bacteroidia bacterium]